MSNGQETQITKYGSLPAMIKHFDKEDVKNTFRAMLGELAPAFLNSYLNIIKQDSKLQKCTENSLRAAIMIPATLKLPVEKSLGQIYFVPFGDQVTVIIGYKGIIQLCIRSGQYETINCAEVYRDEFISWNPLTGQIKFVDDLSKCTLRGKADQKDVVGYYAYFKLLSGFEKSDYMAKEEAFAHAEKFSKAYQYDLKSKKKESLWSTNPNVAGCKTVIKRLLTRFGVMSVEMRDAIKREEDFEEAEEETRKEIEAEQGSEVVDAEFVPEESESEPEPEKTKQAKKSKKKAAKKQVWKCTNEECENDEVKKPERSGKGEDAVLVCPDCLYPVVLYSYRWRDS